MLFALPVLALLLIAANEQAQFFGFLHNPEQLQPSPEAGFDSMYVSGQVDFQTLQNGPSYPARTTISMPQRSLRAVVENFDYLRQQ
jgi:hypothetical protein